MAIGRQIHPVRKAHDVSVVLKSVDDGSSDVRKITQHCHELTRPDRVRKQRE